MILAILNFPNAQCLPSSLSSIRLLIQQQMWFENFQHGCHSGHLGYQTGTILAILNLYAAPMPSSKFPLHPTLGLGADNKWRLSRWPPGWSSWIRFWWWCRKCEKLLMDIWVRYKPSWISEQNYFSNSESLCCKAPGELTIDDLFKMAAVATFMNIVTIVF